ncbi:MAG: hypothetical protein RL338_39 [Chloroflexota bacterium]
MADSGRADDRAGREADRIAALGFDDALAELQRTVVDLEAGGQPLETTIELYERGVALHERCAALLAEAELRVATLVERAGGALRAVPGSDPSGESPSDPGGR